jgi:hypothetical protein
MMLAQAVKAALSSLETLLDYSLDDVNEKTFEVVLLFI